MSTARHDPLGALLVFGQFACIAVLLFGGGWDLPWWGWALFALGLLVFFLAATALGGNNITAMPTPLPGNTLTKRGIYKFVRHPMYLSVLLCGAAMAFGVPSPWRWTALAVTVVVLVAKIRHEERRLTEKHPDYPEVMRGVARLVPGIW
ncbi:MAG: isoprenylcysteine carboxylmethyltransferase family protein [Flavobacteriales bacterium]